MSLPGFTADTALAYAGTQMAATTGQGSGGRRGKVSPQACVNIGPCRICVTAQIFPPRACLQFSCLGFNRSFCVP